MVKFLLCNIYGSGHVFPSIELARNLVAAGHEVIFFTHERFADKIAQAGAIPKTYGEKFTLGDYAKDKPFPGTLFPGAVLGMLPIILKYIGQEESKANFIPFDAIIFDSFALAGLFAAKILNRPAIRSSSSFPGAYSQSFPQFYPEDDPFTSEAVQVLTEKYSLIEGKDFFLPQKDCLQESVNSPLSIVYTIDQLQPKVGALNHGQFCFAGSAAPEKLPCLSELDEKLFVKVKSWTDGDNIFVYISMGTVASLNVEMLSAFISGVNSFGGKYKALITGVSESLREETQSLDLSHCILTSFAPQLHILSISDIFISHCGMNSLNESLYFGVPIIAIPFQEEQMFNANAAKDKGAAIVLEKTSLTSEGISGALKEIQDGQYRENAKSLSQFYPHDNSRWNDVVTKIIDFIKE